MIQLFVRFDDKDKQDADRIKKGLIKMGFTRHLEEKDKDNTNREIWARE